jgi:hypothetical protein
MAGDNTIPFPPRGLPSKVTSPDHKIVEILEQYLELARAGKVAFIALAALDQHGVGVSSWEPEGIPPRLTTAAIGTVSFLNHRFNDACLEGADFASDFEGTS